MTFDEVKNGDRIFEEIEEMTKVKNRFEIEFNNTYQCPEIQNQNGVASSLSIWLEGPNGQVWRTRKQIQLPWECIAWVIRPSIIASGFICEQIKQTTQMSTCLAPMASTDAELECHTVSLLAATLCLYSWIVNSEVEPGTQLTISTCSS